jgi:hypothetical protein
VARSSDWPAESFAVSPAMRMLPFLSRVAVKSTRPTRKELVELNAAVAGGAYNSAVVDPSKRRTWPFAPATSPNLP